ncbi:MAG: retroviral-like aspartic protease family protein [Bacteroidales bacterium]|nr:retroviral-like aspartic protease family protein [Bacteroidales bacterium]
MSLFNKKYDGNANNIVTNTIVFPGVELEQMTTETPRFYSENALWDTGAQVTVISEKVVKSLGLKPYGKGIVLGIGGESSVDTYHIHVLLPNGFLAYDVEAYCSDIDNDILIGMDIINLTDFIITNTDGNTNFIMRAPSEGVNI